MLNLILQLALLIVPIMQSGTRPLRIGEVGRQLTEQDVAALEAALPSDAKPWLLIGDYTQFLNAQYVEAFLQPTTETQLLRRGMIISAERWTPTSPWVLGSTYSYAQVAIPGRRFDDIRDDRDMNRPFRLVGQFDDMDLVRIVQYLRSNPPTKFAQAIQPWPILWVKRKADDSVEVPLMEEVTHGQAITLRQSGQDWVIVAVGGWAA